MNQIIINNLDKCYGKKKVLSGINLTLSTDFVYFLIAENGSGKTTFFKCLLDETSYTGVINDKKLLYAYLPEKIVTPEFVTVKKYLKLYLKVEKNNINECLVDDYLERFGIIEYKNKYINKLSKGTKQKVYIIKMLLSNADVYLFDEPLSGLDKNSRNVFVEYINSLNKSNKIIIIASHYYDEYKIKNKKVIEI